MTSYAMIGIIIAGIASSIVFGTYMYAEYQPNFITVQAGQPVQVGPVVYTVEHIGEHKGDKDIKPENIFFQIKISAENVGSETTLLSGGQFYLLDESDKKHSAVYGKLVKKIFTMIILNQMFQLQEPPNLISHMMKK